MEEEDNKKKILFDLLKGQIVSKEYKTYREIKEHFANKLIDNIKEEYFHVFPNLTKIHRNKHESIARQLYWSVVQLFDHLVETIDLYRDEKRPVSWESTPQQSPSGRIDDMTLALLDLLPEEERLAIYQEEKLHRKFESLKDEIHNAIKRQSVEYFPILYDFTSNGYIEIDMLSRNFAVHFYNMIMDEIGDFIVFETDNKL